MKGLALALVMLPACVLAWPVDWVHDVESQREKFVKLPKLDWVEVDEPAIAEGLWVAPSNDLVLVGLKPGRAVMLLGADGKVAAWRIRVGGKPLLDDKVYAAAQKACPDFAATPLEEVKLTVSVKTEACRVALAALFETDAFEARHLELTFDGAVLQTQLKLIQVAIDKIAKGRVTARYSGAGLVLDGTRITRAEYTRVLWAILKNSLGRFALDTRVEVIEPALDGGSSR